MKISLIITTYNWHQALEMCLLSTLSQSQLPNEIIIADDGSGHKTKDIIKKIIKTTTIKIIHSWQNDNGFRAAKSRNLAIKKSHYEYIICIDGDMILHKNFIKDHLKIAEINHYIQGSRVLLSDKYSQQILKDKTFHPPHFLSKNIKNNLNGWHNIFFSFLMQLSKSKKIRGIKSCNFSFFKTDFIRVNGFNEDFITWGREDSEFIVRLYNTGIQRKNLKFGGIQYHLHHKEGNSNSQNDEILMYAIKNKSIYCENGLSSPKKVKA